MNVYQAKLLCTKEHWCEGPVDSQFCTIQHQGKAGSTIKATSITIDLMCTQDTLTMNENYIICAH